MCQQCPGDPGLLCPASQCIVPTNGLHWGVLCSTLVQISSDMWQMFDDVRNGEYRENGWMNVFQLEVKTTSLIGWLKYQCCNFRQTEQTAIVVAFSWYSLGTLSNIAYMSGFPGQSGHQLGRGRYSTQNCTKSDKYYLLFCTCYYRITELAVVAI